MKTHVLLSVLLSAGDDIFPMVLIGVAISVGLFFALREVWLWYFKINTIVKAQQQTNLLLKAILDQLSKQNTV